jgi:hypothetical protein
MKPQPLDMSIGRDFVTEKPMVFIRLRPNTLQFVAGMRGNLNRAIAYQSESGFGFGAISHHREIFETPIGI